MMTKRLLEKESGFWVLDAGSQVLAQQVRTLPLPLTGLEYQAVRALAATVGIPTTVCHCRQYDEHLAQQPVVNGHRRCTFRFFAWRVMMS